jgi:hypothetical protein
MSQARDMNCEDFRRALTADPGFEDETRHADACVDCREYSAAIMALDADIAAAMAIAVPKLKIPPLPDIDVAEVSALSSRRPFSKPAWFALAATVLLAAVLGIRMAGPIAGMGHGSLEEQVLAHVDHEPLALLPSSTPVSDSEFSVAVPKSVATMNRDVGLITFAAFCSINGNDVPHLVMQGKHGPITILLMPHEKVDTTKVLDGVNVHGVILGVGEGSIAIIGNRDEPLEKVQQNVLGSVMWST